MVDINSLIDSTLDLKRYSFNVNGIEISENLDNELPLTTGDPYQLQQVFLNIMNNAEHEMLKISGERVLSVTTRVCHRGDESCIICYNGETHAIFIEFKDTGLGVPEKIQSRIFDPFFTTKEVGEGTGLGLSVSYGIIKEHKGNIYVASSSEKGATFIIELPIRTADLKDILGSSHNGFIKTKEFKGLSVLVIEDEEYILGLFKDLLVELGLNVDVTIDVYEAQRLLEKNNYNMIITDIKMPQISGINFYEGLKMRHPELAERVVFVTGDVLENTTRDFIEKSGCSYILKQFRLNEFYNTIYKTLGERHA